MADGLRADGVYEFGDFRLIAAQRRLTVRSDGRAIEPARAGPARQL